MNYNEHDWLTTIFAILGFIATLVIQCIIAMHI